MSFGQEMILDLHSCNRVGLHCDLELFCKTLADLIDMKAEDFHYWKSHEDDDKIPELFGVSAIQFIRTSNITIHVLPLLNNGSVYLNLFSCKPFDKTYAAKFVVEWFDAGKIYKKNIVRN